MKKTLILLLFSSIFINCLLSQDTIQHYYDKDWKKISNKNAAIYYGKSFKNSNKLWVTKDYFISNQLQMVGTFKSKKLKVKLGHFTYYHENGKLKSEGNYLKVKNDGNCHYYYEN